MRRLLSLIVLLLGSLAALLLLLEVGVRIARVAPPPDSPGWFFQVPDPVTGWSHLPNSSGRWFNERYEYDVAVQINSRGLRAPESVGYAKAAGVYRVLVLGDSFVEALQVELAEAFHQQLAHLLAAAGDIASPVEVIAAGVGGWGTDQALLWYRAEGVKYSPDLVLLSFFPANDFMNNAQPLETLNFGSIHKPFFSLQDGRLDLHYFPFDPAALPQRPAAAATPAAPADSVAAERPLAGLGAWGHDHSALYRYLHPRLHSAAPRLAAVLARWGVLEPGQESKEAELGPDYIPVAYGIYRQPLEPAWTEALTLSQALLVEFKQNVESSAAAFGVLIATAPEQVYPTRWRQILAQYEAMGQGHQRWDPQQANAAAAEALQGAGIPALNLLPLFVEQAAAGAALHLAHDGHWTVYGHRLAATALYNFVRSGVLDARLAGSPLPLPQPAAGRSWWDWLLLLILGLLLFSLVWSLVRTGPVAWGRSVAVHLGTAAELVLYMGRRRHFLLMPLLLALLILGGLLIVAQSSVVGPFIYTLF